MVRFYRLWLAVEDGQFPPDIGAGRLIQMVERLPLYGGVLTARAQAEVNKKHQPGDVRDSQPGIEVIGSSGAELLSHPATAGLIEYAKA